MQILKLLGIAIALLFVPQKSMAQDLPANFYTSKIQPIFDQRCLGCHSCFNAPCQFNLQNHDGFIRGATKLNVYDGTRVGKVEPTRLWIDGLTKLDWRKKQFYDVNTSIHPDENLFLNFLKLRAAQPNREIKAQVADSQICAATDTEYRRVVKNAPELGMPYGLPPLSAEELGTLTTWVSKGAPGPSPADQAEANRIPDRVKMQLVEWDLFLNENSPEQHLVSRYIYEHLFLAHISFAEDANSFYRLIRSSTPCNKELREIATRRPNDDPGINNFFYCLRKFPGTIVKKTHITYRWSPAKLERYRKIFWSQPWKVKEMPTYHSAVAQNPFIAFKDIPVRSRYQFLLDDAHYHVNTFIKGPVCNGSMAVNAIQEQFFVFFQSPDSDKMVVSQEYASKAQELLILPGSWGSEVEIQQTPMFMKKLIDHRESYRKLRNEWQAKLKPNGYTLENIWNGDLTNPSAVLTIFRHDDNAVVMTGAVGDLAKTVFVLDYPLFERLVYNLVVNFDVFGNVGHQYLTRLYMDLIRMEAEELFLSFLPPENRSQYRKDWYRGFLTEAVMSYIFPSLGTETPTGIRFDRSKDVKKQMVEKLLFEYFTDTARGQLDPLNWKALEVPSPLRSIFRLDNIDAELRKLTSVKASAPATTFPQFFPELSLMKIRTSDGNLKVYSIMRNKEHENISWVLAESLRLAPEEDSLTIREGYWGSYPNMIFEVAEAKITDFVRQTAKIKSESDFQDLVSEFGIRRTHAHFWNHYDELSSHFRRNYPEEFGYLDLTRYQIN